MFNTNTIPSHLQREANNLNQQIADLNAEILKAQGSCKHTWQKVTWKDPNYSPRLDGVGKGDFDVIKEFHCSKCKAQKPLEELCFIICHLCGGQMKHDHLEQFGMDRAHIHKCQTCGHEYDTT